MKCINHPEIDAVGVCISCGKHICEMCKVESEGEIYCKNCISAKVSTQAKKQKSPALAAVLSFVIGGMGQVYNGQTGKGLLIFFTAWLVIPWIYGIIDAYRTANKINSGEIIVPFRMGCTVAAIIFMVIVPIILAILGLLVAIAVPSFIVAREAAQANLCVNNLRLLYHAKEQYAIDNNLYAGAIIPSADDNGIDDMDGIPDTLEWYFGVTPKCPSGGEYSLGAVGALPTCSIGDKGTTMTRDDHILWEE